MMKVTKISGRTRKIRRCVLSAVTDINSVDTTCDPT